MLLISGGGGGTATGPKKVTLAGPKSDIGKAEKSHKGQMPHWSVMNACNAPLMDFLLSVIFLPITKLIHMFV